MPLVEGVSMPLPHTVITVVSLILPGFAQCSRRKLKLLAVTYHRWLLFMLVLGYGHIVGARANGLGVMSFFSWAPL